MDRRRRRRHSHAAEVGRLDHYHHHHHHHLAHLYIARHHRHPGQAAVEVLAAAVVARPLLAGHRVVEVAAQATQSASISVGFAAALGALHLQIQKVVI